MRICGIEGVSVIDYPGRIASVLFLGGCNFRCPFCQNSELVLHPEWQPNHDPGDILDVIERRKGLVDGVVVTGGEPLIHKDALLALLSRLREAGLAVKLDTNGYEVETLRDVVSTGLVDFVAMDIKTSLGKYEAAAGKRLDVERIRDAIDTIVDTGVGHEFRTTCVPGLVETDDVQSIASLLGPGEDYVLQQFRATSPLIDHAYATLKPHLADTLRSFAESVRPLVRSVTLRGA